MQRNKYLEGLGLKIEDYGGNYIYKEKEGTDRRKLFEQQRKDYGFDSRETWDLTYYFAEWLYSHLMMYKEFASEVVNLKYYKFDWQGREITQIEAIDILIKTSKDYLLMDELEMSNKEIVRIREDFYKAMKLWGEILHYMWW